MQLHQKLIKATEIPGYKAKPGGLCHGFSLKWLESMLLNKEALFCERIKNFFTLAAAGADLDKSLKNGATPASIAKENGHKELIPILTAAKKTKEKPIPPSSKLKKRP